ncbi:hypothetical protein QAD02_005416 [Eretmocerus hayati]|uniref:Uncharacterized protein n=1 Tax=Eretmocerus hayati TaxID=131215 RepID=A0ACC2NSE8_9HYME|nr:hypothetical protein QAD02_005416 [Eretmocerus hayati]
MNKEAKRSLNYRWRKKIFERAQKDSEEHSTSEPLSSCTSYTSSYSRRDRSSDYVNPSSDDDFDGDISLGVHEENISSEPSQSIACLAGGGESENDHNYLGRSCPFDNENDVTNINCRRDSSSSLDDGSMSGSTDNSENSEDGDETDNASIDSTENCVEQRHEQQLKNEITRLQEWAVIYQIPAVHLDALLKILRERLLPELPASSKTFLYTGTANYSIEDMKDSHGLDGEFAYLGIKNGLEACLNPDLHEDGKILLDINADGVKIKKSSKKNLWPVMIRVFYPKMPHIYKPFSACVFYGKGKPADVKQFLYKFIQEMNLLSSSGVTIKLKRYTIIIRTIIADTPARDFLKGTKGHSSLNGCSRCDTEAIKIDNNVVYQSVGNARTDNDFRNFTDTKHHKSVSPLIALVPMIDMIRIFILDSMHLLYLGFMLKIFNSWKDGQPSVKLSVAQRNEMDRRTLMIKKDIPFEFKRKMRSTNEFADYKATDHRFFVIYASPVVLKKILNNDCYNHFMLFHAACRMLSSKEAVNHVRLAREYLKEFVEKSKELYGLKFLSLNIHCGHHLADDVEFTQSNINDISAFPFESELRLIKEILRSPNNTLAQYCRRVHEQRTILDQTARVERNLQILKITKSQEIMKMIYKQQFFSNNHPDNTVLLNDGSVVKIIYISKVDDNVCIRVMDYNIKKLVYDSPCLSSLFNIFEIDEKPGGGHSRNITLDNISTKMVKLSINFAPDDPMRKFVLPILHCS